MSYAGKLIIAPPKVKGTFWARSVVFISEDSHLGSVGVVLNKPSKMSLRDFGNQCDVDLDYEGEVYVGGPANSKALSSSEEVLNRLAIGDTPYYWRLIVGLSTWTPDQLECEVKGKHPYTLDSSWLVATPNHHLVFGLDTTDQWATAIEQSSLEFSQNFLA
jgi:putative transcriptional regulator